MSEPLIDYKGFYSERGAIVLAIGELMKLSNDVMQLQSRTSARLCVDFAGLLEDIALQVEKLRVRAGI
jgi:hypothetical protein